MLSATFDNKLSFASHETSFSCQSLGALQSTPSMFSGFVAAIQPTPTVSPCEAVLTEELFDIRLSAPPANSPEHNTIKLEGCAPVEQQAVHHQFHSTTNAHAVPVQLAPLQQQPLPAAVTEANLVKANRTISRLEDTVEVMSLRIKELESMIVGSSRASTSTDTPPMSSHCIVETPLSKPLSSPTSSLALSLISKMETDWYCDRPYPALLFNLVDQQARSYSNLKFKVRVSLIDGFGDVSCNLGGPAASDGFVFESNDEGVVEVNNIRFTQVSSKAGGHYTLVVKPWSENEPSLFVSEFKSERMTVLSYRLFNARKFDFDRLSATDPLSKVKGIGSLYAKRFAALGILTVRDLAVLVTEQEESHDAPTTATSCRAVVADLRKVRGALTHQKLEEYVLHARAVLERQSAAVSTTSQLKRVRHSLATSPTVFDHVHDSKRRRFASLPTDQPLTSDLPF